MIVLDEAGGRARRSPPTSSERLSGSASTARERRPWLPHVTVLRFRERAGPAAPALPNIRSIHVVRAALYRSRLRPGGAQYDALETASR